MNSETPIEKEPEFKLTDIFGSMREGILILGENMIVSAANTAARKALSPNGLEIQNKRLSEVLRDYTLHSAFERAIRWGKSSEVRIEIIGEALRIYDVVVSPLNLENRSAAIGVFYDITRIENLERIRQEFLSKYFS